MATPYEVRASLLAVSDHGRDGVARKRLADQVRATTVRGATGVRDASRTNRDVSEAIGEAAKATAAVVLASDLRAPVDDWRERLANVERLLAESGIETIDPVWGEIDHRPIRMALSEVRQLLGEG